jgi:prepilin-type N-terminal cleavage/methylation domain-containing protein
MRTGSPSSGFTLLELLVVVAILSATALAAFNLASEDRAQVRIDDTRNRLTILRRAILGPEAPVYGGEMRLAGYVADNGRLPTSLRELLDEDGHKPRAGAKPKKPGSAIDDQCIQSSSTDPDELAVLKGHRGNYLAGAAHRGEFRDGWGNVDPDLDPADPDFGWKLTPIATGNDIGIEIRSLGLDNALDADPPDPDADPARPEADRIMPIADADWRTPLDGWQVTFKNVGDVPLQASEYGASNFDELGFVLLVFENIDETGRWREYRSAKNSCDASELPPEGVCHLSFVGDGQVMCNMTGSIAAKVPLGRHVLALTVNGALPSSAGRRIVTLVDFFPGAHPPNLTLAARQ